jgi:hypothetical protein
MGAVIKAVFKGSSFDITGAITSLLTIGDINPDSVHKLVSQAKAEAGQQKIDRLDWYAHGGQNTINAGDEDISELTPKVHFPVLARLKPNFDPEGYVRLFVCNAGLKPASMCVIAQAFGVEVYGCEGDVRPGLYGTPFVVSGQLVMATPKGHFFKGKGVENVFYYSDDDE